MTFMNVDKDRSGFVDGQELKMALATFGYRLQQQTIDVLVRRFSNNGRIGFDDFVSCCVKLRALTGKYSSKFILYSIFCSSFPSS